MADLRGSIPTAQGQDLQRKSPQRAPDSVPVAVSHDLKWAGNDAGGGIEGLAHRRTPCSPPVEANVRFGLAGGMFDGLLTSVHGEFRCTQLFASCILPWFCRGSAMVLGCQILPWQLHKLWNRYVRRGVAGRAKVVLVSKFLQTEHGALSS